MSMFWKLIFQLVLPILILVGACQLFGYYWDTDAPLSVAVAGSGLFSFVVFFSWSQSLGEANPSPESSLRGAIAAAIVVEYVVLVSIVAFFKQGPDRLPPITESLISSFTTVVGVVVAFYFGSSAFIQVYKQNDESTSKRKENIP